MLLYYHLSDLQISEEHSVQSLPGTTIICIMMTLSSTIKHRKQSKVLCVPSHPCLKELMDNILMKNNRMVARDVWANRFDKIMICTGRLLPYCLPYTLCCVGTYSELPNISTRLLESCLSEEINSVAVNIKNFHFITEYLGFFYTFLLPREVEYVSWKQCSTLNNDFTYIPVGSLNMLNSETY